MKLGRIIDSQGFEVWVSLLEDGRLVILEQEHPGSPFNLTDNEVKLQRWLPPIDPRAFICIGLNYRNHAAESGKQVPQYPVVFMKNPMAVAAHGDAIKIPSVCEDEVDYEAELAVVIGKPCLNASKEDALNYVLGYTVANDVSARIWQTTKSGSQWVRGKSFDTFAPIGPVIVTPDEIPNPNELSIRAELNGEEVQNSNTRDMIFDVPTLISFLSQGTTLLPGTVILTGTPEGVGWSCDPKRCLQDGDEIVVEIESIGTLKNSVKHV